ncbi:DUF6082 family protein [Streptomyces cupreus]|uniref:Uncharacterized protein n=1 Tax=Streptomyces cupreus TaxID=2759956 RepID=A0A7X1MCY9_9ACTN|nr:DUF6082 family protein [Streptomyces cupreus]MBC2904135.1 hypothetical protein [Streptomyces cupreus]
MATTLVIALTPLVLQAVAPASKDWERLSDISQTYGALSVLFSAAALVGVAASLAYQARQTEIANDEAQRASHRELVLAAINDADLVVCYEPGPLRVSLRTRRQLWFSNLIVHHWFADYRLKRINDDILRVLLTDHFKGEAARRHWDSYGDAWRRYVAASGERRAVRFAVLVDEVYATAVAEGPPTPSRAYLAPPS